MMLGGVHESLLIRAWNFGMPTLKLPDYLFE